MVCSGIDVAVNVGLTGILQYPTSCDYWFYGKILSGIFIILSFILYYRDKDRLANPDIVGSLGVSAIATIFLALIGTLLGIVQQDVFITLFVGGIIIIALWIFKGD